MVWREEPSLPMKMKDQGYAEPNLLLYRESLQEDMLQPVSVC